MSKFLFRLAFFLAVSVALASYTAPVDGAQSGAGGSIVTGSLVGQKCVETGKLKPCPLEWAYPMVLYTETGTYQLELAPVGVRLWELDRAFGRRVAINGRITGDTVTIFNLALLEPLDEGKVTRA